MKPFKLFSVLLLLLSTHFLSAHEMWIETKPVGKIGTTQEVKVFFGEFSWNKPTPTAKWFSDIADCILILTSPDGKTTILEKTKEDTYYKANFTPTQNGMYKLSFVHVVKDVYKEMKLTYISAALVNVSAPKKESVLVWEGQYQLQIQNSAFVKNYPTHFTVLENGKSYDNKMVEISNLDSATQNITTNTNGVFALPKNWKGGQLIQLSHPLKMEGEKQHNGKTYTTDYTVFTFYTKA
jgi:hypothetical protein